MGWLIALIAVVLLGFLPIGIYASYDQKGPWVSLMIGPLRICLYPKQPKSEKRRNASDKDTMQLHSLQKKRKFGSFSDFTAIANLVFEFLADFRRKLIIRKLEFKVILAETDPYDLSIQYGLGWALLGNIISQLERFFVIKKRNLEIECDYTASEKLLEARIDMVISLGRLLWIVLRHGPHILRKYNSIVNQTKGGNLS
jgi:lipopolysaccharide biosynthesis protein